VTRSQRVLAAAFVAAGTLHVARPGVYTAIMPDYLPAHRELVLASGAAEIAGGLGVALPVTRRAAGRGLVVLLAAVFPANLHMALHPERFASIPPALLWARLPLQAAMVAAVYRIAVRPS
jgi:uncharacterized membrane protein